MSIPMQSSSFSAPAGSLAQRPANRGVLGYVAVGLGALLVGVVVVMWAKSGGDRPVNSTNASAPSTPSTSGVSSTSLPGIVCTASSARSSEAGVTYQASNLLDGNLATAWDEGVSGPGIGDWVRCDFGREVKLTRICIAPGYFKSAGLWKQNNRLASATFYASDGSSRRFAFQDLMIEQRFEVDGITATWVRMVVEGTYPGTSDAEDTPISSLSFEGERSANDRATTQPTSQAERGGEAIKSSIPSGNSFVVLGSYPKTERPKADQRLGFIQGRGYDARIVDTDNYPSLKPGLWAVVVGPYAKNYAKQLAQQLRAVVPDAYVK
jgi:hypothetical protein